MTMLLFSSIIEIVTRPYTTISFLFCIFLFVLSSAFFQQNKNTPRAAYPQGYFSAPVKFKIRLTGTFGELRSNHFHSGIDIKSPNGKVGHSIYAAADGFIDRIKVSAGGYGNALYIKHPNGYKTVYAHLDDFTKEIRDYIKREQYRKERFEVNLYPKDGRFKVKKGEKIGTLGNSGGSTGPHLHFEIRKSSNDHPINPILFGMPVPDDVPPSIRGLKAYYFNSEKEIIGEKTLSVRKLGTGRYALRDGDTLSLPAWRAGFSLKTYDSMTGFRNDNGAYQITMQANNEEVYKLTLEELSFDETRYLNAHIDYPAKQNKKGYYNRCFVLPGNKLNNYVTAGNEGIVPLYTAQTQRIEIRSLDVDGNFSSLVFWVKRDADMGASHQGSYQYLLPYNQANIIENQTIRVSMKQNTLYENLYMDYANLADESHGCYSSVHHLHDNPVAIHRYYELSIRDDQRLPEELRSKAIIADCSGGEVVNCGGAWNDFWVKTKVRQLGDFCLLVDTEAPTITARSFQYDMSNRGYMSFSMKDNFKTSGRAKSLKYRATVDGKWILMEHDGKRNRLSHTFDGRIGRGKHLLKLVVTDDRNNEAVFEQEFIR